MAILLVWLETRAQRRSSAGLSNTIALRKLGTRKCPCLNRFLSLKAPPLAAGIFYFRNFHAGPKETHVFHLHAHQWLRDWRDANSVYLDSQTISPGASFHV